MALGQSTFADFGAGISDLFASEGHRARAAGDRAEGINYGRAATLADQNEQFTEWSTNIKQMQSDRQMFNALGTTRADVAGAGFAESGTAIDLLRDSASQGALSRAVQGEQGLITEAGYKEQADSYRTMQAAATMAAHAEDTAAIGADITGTIRMIAGIATLAP